jgi:uncharacterized membrane protein
MGPAELAVFANRLFEAVYEEAKDDPDHNFPNVFEHGERLGAGPGDVTLALELLVDDGLLQWRTTHWVQLTHAGLRAGRRRFGAG